MSIHNKIYIKKNLAKTTSKIRVIGGRWRGRKLPVLNKLGLRPTTNIARETLFNWLESVIQGTHCLDCFAGSGALGIEAFSRGATSVTLLEKDWLVSNQLIRNLKLLKVSQIRVINVNSLKWLSQPGDIFDIVFIDPPFYRCLADQVIILLERYHRLSDRSWIYIETEINNTTLNIPSNWKLYRKKISGSVIYRLYIHYITKI